MFGTYAEPQWGALVFQMVIFRVVIRLIGTAVVSLQRATSGAIGADNQASIERKTARSVYSKILSLEYAAFKVNVCVVYPRVMRAYFSFQIVRKCLRFKRSSQTVRKLSDSEKFAY